MACQKIQKPSGALLPQYVTKGVKAYTCGGKHFALKGADNYPSQSRSLHCWHFLFCSTGRAALHERLSHEPRSQQGVDFNRQARSVLQGRRRKHAKSRGDKSMRPHERDENEIELPLDSMRERG